MTSFSDEIANSFPSGITLPDELRALFDWMEKTGGFLRNYGGTHTGREAVLYPLGSVVDETDIFMNFAASDPRDVSSWLGIDEPSVCSRLTRFFCTGGDGSSAGIWLDDSGKQKFVHCGSGSGSTLCCVLTDNPVEFLRLLAIGYEELCWPDDFDGKPQDAEDVNGLPPPLAFQNWVQSTYQVTIPTIATEIVRSASLMGDKQSDDPFWQWSKKPYS